MKRLVLEIVICLLTAAFLMVVHELLKAVIYFVLRGRNQKHGKDSRAILNIFRYIDPLGLILAVTCYVPVSKPYMFRIRDRRTNLIIGISGLILLVGIFFGSAWMIHIIYRSQAGLLAAFNSGASGMAGVLFWKYMQMLSFDYFVVNMFPVSSFDMGHIIAGTSARIYLGIIKADTSIKLILILVFVLDLINRGYLSLIKNLPF